MQTVTLTLLQFGTAATRLWAFSQMGLMHGAIRRLDGLEFYKLMGTGAGAGFSTKPDCTTYTLLAVWRDQATARAATATAATTGVQGRAFRVSSLDMRTIGIPVAVALNLKPQTPCACRLQSL